MIIEAVRRTTRTDCGHGCVIRRAGEERASAPIRALVAVFVAFACAISVSSYAFAEESGGGGGGHSFEGPNVGIIFYGPTPALDSNANQVTEVGVTAYNEFDAAAYVLGYSYGEVRSWSADIRAKLSNSEAGGRFWQFAKTFTHTSNIDGVHWFTANLLYGVDLCWRSLYSDELYRNALTDCQTIINGGDVGGGGSGVDGDYWVFDFKANSGNLQNIKTVYVSKEHIAFSGDLFGFGDAAMSGVIKFNSYNASSHSIGGSGFWLCSDPALTTEVTDGVYSLVESHKDTYFSSISGGTWNVQKIEGDSLYVIWSGNSNLSYKYNYSKKFISNATNNVGVLVSSGSQPTIPPTNWPDEPSAPSPPELPEPGTNPTVTPTPWSPVISPTFDFDLNITTEPTSNDLIDWVKKIYFELRSFHSDAQDWFDEVGKGIDGVVKAVNDAQRQIYSELQTIDDTLRDEGQKIRDYMYQMFHWLKDQLNFQNDTFNDSNIVYWLKRIWSKLGNGDINVRPTDPTTDPTGVWDWLIKLIQNFLIGLASSANDLISEMADLVSQVMHEFPFSIPWDIAAFLAAFAAAPITPDVDVTIPAIDGWWGETVISIDLSPYDTAAAAVRAMEKILFAAFLAWKSKDLLDFMDVTKWFNG